MDTIMELDKQKREKEKILIANVRSKKKVLVKLLDKCESHWGFEDCIYRLYHQSFKVYRLQDLTQEIVSWLRAVSPEPGPELVKLDTWFETIIADGTHKQFSMDHNKNWLKHTRPIVEAAFHALYMLKMLLKYAGDPKFKTGCLLESGWAAVLELYNLR